jgi:hypothetical protein
MDDGVRWIIVDKFYYNWEYLVKLYKQTQSLKLSCNLPSTEK